MTSLDLRVLKSGGRPHGVKRWQLNGTDYQPAVADGSSRFSAWTPITNKTSNQQLFQERTTLILHWFDLWTDLQRKQFIQLLLPRCSKSQLKFASDWFMEMVPITHMDFTAVLPRCLSLYILSFLSPLHLCAAAQVSWHWRFLAEQDCLWSPKCVRQGWFLPYTPSDSEYGTWKRHYISCASSLDFLTPREASDLYGALNETLTVSEEQEERQKERMIRQTIREKIEEHKRAAVKSRRAWLSNSLSAGTLSNSLRQSSQSPGLTTALVHLGDKCRLQYSLTLPQVKRGCLSSSNNSTLGRSWGTSPVKSLTMGSSVKRSTLSSLHSPPLCLLLVSSRVPAYELVLSGLRVGVLPMLYDHSGSTLDALLSLAERLLQGRRLHRLGILAETGTDHIHLLDGVNITEQTVLSPCVREFWERLCGWVEPGTESGCLDIFGPLAASAAGEGLLTALSSLTGLNVRAPTGISSGSHQHILSEWLGPGDFPPLDYLCQGPLLSWCGQAEALEEALGALRDQLGSQLQLLSRETRARTLGLFLWDNIKLPEFHIKPELTRALTEGLMALSNEEPGNPVEFLAGFLQRVGEDGGAKPADGAFLTQNLASQVLSPIPESPQGTTWGVADRRPAVVRELVSSERAYVCVLQAVADVYFTPLRAALDSNRAILSSANVLMVFSPLLDILEVNSIFLRELMERLEEWDPLQCVGDVCVKFCTKLRVYTNFFNNYPTTLRTIDKCRELVPAFRAFLRRHDRSLVTRMLSLQEMLLTPSSRVEEYVPLLQALSLHTPPEHPDHTHLSSALNTLRNYRSFIRKLRKSSGHEARMLETQSMIQGCPNLQEGNRYLIMTQDVALLTCSSDDITASLRMYEHVSDMSLVLFNDAVVLSERSVSHQPFCHAVKTTHTFLASVALHSLTLQPIVNTKYVQNAFVLEGPMRRWICATEREEDKLRFLCALRSVMNTAIAPR